MRWVFRLLAALLVLSAANAQGPSEVRRVALVIGNADYNLNTVLEFHEEAEQLAIRQNLLPDLRNPINDAQDVRDALVRHGFDIVYAENADADTMLLKLNEFGTKVATAGPNALVFVYFSGHGLQLDGENFLIPAGARLPATDYRNMPAKLAQAAMGRVAISMELVRSQLQPREGKGANIIVLDACRNNPWDPSTRAAGGRGRGLADMAWGMNSTLIAFSTEPGKTAYDGDASVRNSPYTGALKSEIAGGDIDVALMFRRVANKVQAQTQGFRDGAQRPWTNAAPLPEDICLRRCPARLNEEASGGQVDRLVADAYLWQACCEKPDVTRADLESYLSQVRAGAVRGTFQRVAEDSLQRLPAAATPTAVSAVRGQVLQLRQASLGRSDPLADWQWHLRLAGAGEGEAPGGAGFVGAWRQLSAQMRPSIVAVIGNGLARGQLDFGNNLMPGLDFISEAERAGDGDGRDRDPTDEGDTCGGGGANSRASTHDMGLIAAAVDNRVGVAGVGFNRVKVQPVRALGKCGGSLEDVVDSIRWSAGAAPVTLPDGTSVPNATPADVIVLGVSLSIPCPASMQAAINTARARGAVVVVAAGNQSASTRQVAPSNCENVIVVGASDLSGRMAFYSNHGAELDLMAPGGDMLADADGDGRPDGVLSMSGPDGECIDPASARQSLNCAYGYRYGTSTAAALVGGALGLIKAQTGLAGSNLENALFERAVRPVAPALCAVSCAGARGATPLPDRAGVCSRACGRGALDMSRVFSRGPVTWPAPVPAEWPKAGASIATSTPTAAAAPRFQLGRLLIGPRLGSDDAPLTQPTQPRAELLQAAMQDTLAIVARLGVAAEIQASPNGLIITFADMRWEGQQPRTEAFTGQTCPRTVTRQQLEADAVLSTICTLQRLRASAQFEYVELVYVAGGE